MGRALGGAVTGVLVALVVISYLSTDLRQPVGAFSGGYRLIERGVSDEVKILVVLLGALFGAALFFVIGELLSANSAGKSTQGQGDTKSKYNDSQETYAMPPDVPKNPNSSAVAPNAQIAKQGPFASRRKLNNWFPMSNFVVIPLITATVVAAFALPGYGAWKAITADKAPAQSVNSGPRSSAVPTQTPLSKDAPQGIASSGTDTVVVLPTETAFPLPIVPTAFVPTPTTTPIPAAFIVDTYPLPSRGDGWAAYFQGLVWCIGTALDTNGDVAIRKGFPFPTSSIVTQSSLMAFTNTTLGYVLDSEFNLTQPQEWQIEGFYTKSATYDGTNVWLAGFSWIDRAAGIRTAKVRKYTLVGELLIELQLGEGTANQIIAGSDAVWVVFPDSIVKIALDGDILWSVDPLPTNLLTWAHGFLWTVQFPNSGNNGNAVLLKIDQAGNIVGSYLTAFRHPTGIEPDASGIWLYDRKNTDVSAQRFDVQGNSEATVALAYGPSDLVFDGEDMWGCSQVLAWRIRRQ